MWLAVRQQESDMEKAVGWTWLGGTLLIAWLDGGLSTLIVGTAVAAGAGYGTKRALDKAGRDRDRDNERKNRR